MQEYKVTVGEYMPGATRFYKPGTTDLHRLDGPAVEYADGSKLWYQNGKLHRTDGPAMVWANGAKSWYQNGKLHRTDGPAVEWAPGAVEYWIDGKRLSEEQFKKATAPVKEMTIAEIEALLGHYVKVVK